MSPRPEITNLAIASARKIYMRLEGERIPVRKELCRFMLEHRVVSHRWIDAVNRTLEIVPRLDPC